MRRQTLIISERIFELGAGGVVFGARRRAGQSNHDQAGGGCKISCMFRSSDHPYPRKAAPVFFPTSATIFATTASISASVRVRSRGCNVTAMATDLWPSGTP
jgi:hypothetical protein